jgi:MATE family multidrug resistance protein
MEEPLLAAATGKKDRGCEEESLAAREVKKQLYLAGPLVIGLLLQNMVQMVSVMFVGHLGELALASASLATSFAGVTGFSLLVSGDRASPTISLFPSFVFISGRFTDCAGEIGRQAWQVAWTRCAGRLTARGSTTSSASSSSERCWCWPW